MSENRKNYKRSRHRKRATIITLGILLVILGTWEKIPIVNAKEGNEEEQIKFLFENDHASPVIKFLNIRGGGVYNTSEYVVEVSVVDDYKLESIEVYVNEEKQEYQWQEEKVCYTFPLLEDTDSKKIEIVAVDKVGNRARTVLEDVYVTKNLFVRLANDIELLAQLSGLFMLMGGMAVIIIIQYKNERYYDRKYNERNS